MSRCILDAKDGLTVDVETYQNECRTLRVMSKGLRELARNVKERESQWDAISCGTIMCSSYGTDFDGTREHLERFECYFHWFANSVCNFARLVGMVRGLANEAFDRNDLRSPHHHRKVTKFVDDYCDSVSELSNVRYWRNKVSAHFAITAPRRDDSGCSLELSIMAPVTFTNDRYRVGGWSRIQTDAEQTDRAQHPEWSLTEVFESLVPRYWPNLRERPSHSDTDS